MHAQRPSCHTSSWMGDTCPRSVICRGTTLMSEQRKEVIIFLRTSPDTAVVGGAHLSVNRNEYDRTDLHQTTDRSFSTKFP